MLNTKQELKKLKIILLNNLIPAISARAASNKNNGEQEYFSQQTDLQLQLSCHKAQVNKTE